MSQPLAPRNMATWKMITAGICSLILTMGIARFAMTPLLPAMQVATGLGDDGAGFLAAFNYAGYLTGALLASRLRDPNTKVFYYRLGIILAVITTLLMALTDSVILWSILRYISGTSSAAGMVICTSLLLDHLKHRKEDDKIGLHFGGVGLGVIISGSVLTWSGALYSWDISWFIIGIVAFLVAIPALLWITARGLQPVNPAHESSFSLTQRPIMFLLLSYCLAGATFSIGTTFIISIMSASPALADSKNMAWIMVGVALAPSCYFWMKMSSKYGDFKALCAAYLVQAIGAALPVLYPSTTTAIIGGLMFGGTFMGIVSVVLALGGKLSPHNPSALIGILVVSYGVGQIVGPVIAGIAMEATGFSELGLWSASACSLVSILFMLGTRCKNAPKDQPCLA